MPSVTSRRPLAETDPGRLIRDARRAAGITQAELARRAGTTQSMISRWERGHDEPRLATLAAILRACGYEPELVMRRDDGVDRAQIRQHLAMTPEQRLASVRRMHKFAEAGRRARRAASA
ncbi:MAG: helix-turn-helix domain-containing protein [Actinomycetota bacterium]